MYIIEKIDGGREGMNSIITSIFDKVEEKETLLNVKEEKKMEDFGIDISQHQAKIVVVGCGGGGCNTVTRLTEMGIDGASTIALNTDARHLAYSVKAEKKILIGKELTKGLGAGGYPEIGKKAAEESKSQIKEVIKDADLVFVTAGLGGGTGTGSAPVVARLAKEQGSIVIAVVTLPFKIEGARMGKAEDGLARLREVSDTVIVIENQKLLELAGNRPLQEAFKIADELIASMIKGISETISLPSLVNLDFADVRAVMRAGGVASIGIGVSSSENRAQEAVRKALNNPLLEVDYKGASGALIQIIGGPDLKLEEVTTVGEEVSRYLDADAQIIWGARILPEYQGKIQVITIITGVKSPYILGAIEKRGAELKRVSSFESDLGIKMIR